MNNNVTNIRIDSGRWYATVNGVNIRGGLLSPVKLPAQAVEQCCALVAGVWPTDTEAARAATSAKFAKNIGRRA